MGHTSHDVVAILRKKWKAKKVGHAGTLDPAATGLLILLVGRWTRASSVFSKLGKTYTGTIVLGSSTETGDAEGKVDRTAPVPALDAGRVREVLRSFEGEREHRPHKFSAVKISGKPAYWYARKGLVVETPIRKVRIEKLDLEGFSADRIEFRLACSSGTYARTLAEEVGKALGTVSHLAALRRESVGPFSVREALPMKDWAGLAWEEAAGRTLTEPRISEAIGTDRLMPPEGGMPAQEPFEEA